VAGVVCGHHPSFLREGWIGPRADKAKKKKGAVSTFVLRAIKTIADLTSSSLMHPSFCNG